MPNANYPRTDYAICALTMNLSIYANPPLFASQFNYSRYCTPSLTLPNSNAIVLYANSDFAYL